MTVRLIYSPGACSISPHIVLEEIGLPFETQRVITKEGGTRTDAFLRINPKGKVPVLVLDDGTVVTENPVILQFLATGFPDSRLLPDDRNGAFDVLQLCEYLANTVHNFGLTRLFRPQYFCPEPAGWPVVREEGTDVMRKAFDLVAPRLVTAPYLFGEFSIADASLFFFEYHAERLAIEMPDAVERHFRRMLDRPAVREVLEREDLAVPKPGN